MNADDAEYLAKRYVQIHNEASVEYKACFKRVGALMWQGDNCHLLRDDNRIFLQSQMFRLSFDKITKIYGMSCPLTVCDGYPDMTADQHKQLQSEVSAIWNRTKRIWNKELSKMKETLDG